MAAESFNVDAEYFVKAESSYDMVTNAAASISLAAGDAIGLMSLNLLPDQNWLNLDEHVGSPSLQGQIKGKVNHRWNAVARVKPAAAGTPPDVGPMLIASGYAEDDQASDVDYDLNTTLAGLFCSKKISTTFNEWAYGMWVERIIFRGVGGEMPAIEFEGGFASYGFLKGLPITTAATHGAVTLINMANGDAAKLHRGALIQFTTDNNGGGGFVVTARSISANTITIHTALTGIGASEAVTAVNPTGTTTGTTLGNVESNLTIDSVSMGFIEVVVTHETGIAGMDREGTSVRPTRLTRGTRAISGEIEMYYLDENSEELGDVMDGNTSDIAIRFGPNTAAQRMIMNFDKARIHIPATTTPDDGREVTVRANFVAHQNAAANDEMDIKFN